MLSTHVRFNLIWALIWRERKPEKIAALMKRSQEFYEMIPLETLRQIYNETSKTEASGSLIFTGLKITV